MDEYKVTLVLEQRGWWIFKGAYWCIYKYVPRAHIKTSEGETHYKKVLLAKYCSVNNSHSDMLFTAKQYVEQEIGGIYAE